MRRPIAFHASFFHTPGRRSSPRQTPICDPAGARERLQAIRPLCVPITAVLLALLLGATGLAEKPETARDRLVGGEFLYTVKAGDSLTRIAARFGMDWRLLARRNGLAPGVRLAVGQTLRLENRHIVPSAIDEGILINVPQRLLFFFRDGGLIAWYPVGLGRPDWQTATGRFEVVSKKRKPTWHVPASIQREMREHGQPVRTEVPPGPANPLGEYWIGLSGSACGIHATIAPASVYGFLSHGCIRLHPDDAADLFSQVSLRTPVWIAYEPVLLARTAEGAVFLEVNPDIYRRAGDPRTAVDALASSEGVADLLDGARVAGVVGDREGLARRVDRYGDTSR